MSKIGTGLPVSPMPQTQSLQQTGNANNVQSNSSAGQTAGITSHQYERHGAIIPSSSTSTQEVLRDLGGSSSSLVGEGQMQNSIRPRNSSVGMLSPLLNAVREGQSLLQRGTDGDMVSQLQQLLNKAGSGLQVDGKFGPATQQAVRDFQQSHGLKMDGLVGSETLRALESGITNLGNTTPSPTAQIPVPSPSTTNPGPTSTALTSPTSPTTPTPTTAPTVLAPSTQPASVTGTTSVTGTDTTTPVGQRIISESLAENGKVSNNAYDGAEYQGWQHLQDTIAQATRGPLGADGKHRPPGINYPDSSIRTHPRPIWKDGNGKVHHMDWCGVWATRMFQKAGVNCYWEPGAGVKGDVTKVYSPKPDDIKPGDMIVGPGPLWHHAIVTDIQRDATGKPVAFETMNGNHPGIGPGSMPAGNVKAYYRPKETF